MFLILLDSLMGGGGGGGGGGLGAAGCLFQLGNLSPAISLVQRRLINKLVGRMHFKY
jgi:hypothetical protein